jgi:hypothetical protein
MKAMNTEFKDVHTLASNACNNIVQKNNGSTTATLSYASAAGIMQCIAAMLIDGSMTREQAYRRLQELSQE